MRWSEREKDKGGWVTEWEREKWEWDSEREIGKRWCSEREREIECGWGAEVWREREKGVWGTQRAKVVAKREQGRG